MEVLRTLDHKFPKAWVDNIEDWCVAQLAERRSLAGEVTLSCARPAADG